jgi:hypothetical protein
MIIACHSSMSLPLSIIFAFLVASPISYAIANPNVVCRITSLELHVPVFLFSNVGMLSAMRLHFSLCFRYL